MVTKKKLLFIINPNSGKKDASRVINTIPKYLDKDKFSYTFELTEYAEHAIEITQKAVIDKVDVVVAVGGDGIVNEIFQALVHTKTALAILPKGSGNGIARSLKIPMNTRKAIQKLNSASEKTIDTCLFNDQPFLGVSGIGFDGLISSEFAKMKKRGLKTYVKLILLKMMNYKSQSYHFEVGDVSFSTKAFIVAFANTEQYGNNAIIAPKAKLDDGKIDLVIFKDFSKWLIPLIALKVMTKSIYNSKHIINHTASLVKVSTSAKEAHLDGEPIVANQNNTIKVVPNSLDVFV